MKSLMFIPLTKVAAGVMAPTQIPQPLQLDSESYQLWYDGVQELSVESDAANEDNPKNKVSNIKKFIGQLHCQRELDEHEWYFLPQYEYVSINGMAPPLSLFRLDPGSLLSIDQQHWMVTTLSVPQTESAPNEIAQQPCPVCGGELALADVVQCLCGRWMHLEKPENPDDENALNCFLSVGKCGGCDRKTSLEPQIIPDVPDSLVYSSDIEEE